MSHKRIAVVAVHGIANHPRGEIVRAVGDLLLKYTALEKGPQSALEATDLRIATEEVKVPPEGVAVPVAGSRFEERSGYVRALHKRSAGAAGPDLEDLPHGFMREQLRHYQPRGADATYETQRLKTALGKTGDVEIHLHEMFWADISRLGTGFVQIFGELYQLLLHISSLGRQIADFAYAAHRHDRSAPCWHAFRLAIAWAVRLLTIGVPVLNLLVLATVCFPLPGHLLGEASGPVALIGLGLMAGAATVASLVRLPRLPWSVWLLAPPLAAIAAFAGGTLALRGKLFGLPALGSRQLIALEACLALAAIYGVTLNIYNRRRPGVSTVGALFGGLVLASTAVLILQAGNVDAEIFRVALKMVEFLFIALCACWAGLIGLSWLSMALGAIAVAATPADPAERSRVVSAAQTACFAISLPSVLFLIVTLILYRALNEVGQRILPEVKDYQPSTLLVDLFEFPAELPGTNFLNQLIVASATPAFALTLIIVALALVVGFWALLPVVVADLKPPVNNDRRSWMFGLWLTNGYRLLVLGAALVFVAFPMAFTAGLAIQVTSRFYGILPEDESTGRLLTFVALLIVGSAGGLLAFRGRLDQVALGFRPLLDTILDVDNYMREHPRDYNPRARICARYSSLLRYISQWRDGGQPYDALIIVTHSQGTVITAELLRFLHKHAAFQGPWIEQLKKLDTYLITLGCPLRQLYGWRFPHLYAWARHHVDARWRPGIPSHIPADQQPDPKPLGLRKWINAYRSGDYVGRYLWRSDDCDYQWTAAPGGHPIVSEDLGGSRREFCLGAGAHVHYLDESAAVFGKELADLVAHIATGTPLESPFASAGGSFATPSEVLERDEEGLIQRVVDASKKLMDTTTLPTPRGQHPKQHACVRAKFTVAADLPAAFRVGLFATPATYSALIRFSNGREANDTHGDIHGMAIKLLGVPGGKILGDDFTPHSSNLDALGEHGLELTAAQLASPQDFVLIDHPVFFIRNLADYAPFSELLVKLQGVPPVWLGVRLVWFFIARWQWRQLGVLRAARQNVIGDPLGARYWSTTPYAFGDGAVKYAVVPQEDGNAEPPAASSNFLRDRLAKRLEVRPARFDFLVQRQTDQATQPIEDPTVEWDAPWTKVATIEIPSQALDAQVQRLLNLNLAFTPWHCLPEHRPLGAINRARKDIYLQLSDVRRRAYAAMSKDRPAESE